MKNKEHYDLRRIKYRYRYNNGQWLLEFFEGAILESNKIGDVIATDPSKCSDEQHINAITEWLESEFKPFLEVSEGEKIILRNLNPEYGFIYRDNSGTLFVSSFRVSPYDDEEETLIPLEPLSHLFKFIKENETYSIAELLQKPKSRLLYNRIKDDVYLSILTIADFEVSVQKLLSDLLLNVNNKKQRKVIVDMVLKTGLNEYRFLEYDVANDGRIILDSSKTVNLGEDLINLANSFIQEKKDILKNSMLSTAEKERLLTN